MITAEENPLTTAELMTKNLPRHIPQRSFFQCSNCQLHGLCLPGENFSDASSPINMIVQTRKKVAEGNTLYRPQQTFKSIYAIKKGFFKSSMITMDGKEQVTGFFMSGDIIGLDGISKNYHTINSTAIEDSEVCVIPFDILERFSEKHPALLRQLHKIMSQRMIHDQETMLLLGSMKAEKKIALFLINLSDQLAKRGQNSQAFQLRMKRDEIGSYLGLTLETVSRVLSKLQKNNLIKIQQKNVEIMNDGELRELCYKE